MSQILLYTLALLPLVIFVIVVIMMDAFSLTNWKRLTFSIIAGIISFVCVHFTLAMIPETAFKPYFSAVIIEMIKGIPLLYLLQRKRMVMLGDATIYGSAVGAGYGIGENVHIIMEQTVGHGMATLLGFEAAVMHIGCSSLLASGLVMAKQETSSWSYTVKNMAVGAAFLAVTIVHIVHHALHHVMNPLLLTSILVIYFVLSKRHMFKKNETAIHSWIDQCLNNDVKLLASIKQGGLSQTNAGKYLLSIKDAFDPETFFDICCYISEYLELSIAAKSNLLLKEIGFPVKKTEENKNRIKELRTLRKRIGKAGVQALKPIVNIDDVDHWVVSDLL